MTDCAKVAPRTAEGGERGELPHYALLAKNALWSGAERGIRRFDCCNCLMSFLLGDLNDNESPKSIWLGAREKEEGGGDERRGGHCRLTPRKRWENAVLTEREGERKRNEK